MRRVIRRALPPPTQGALDRRQQKADQKRTAAGTLNVQSTWNSARKTKPLATVFKTLKEMAHSHHERWDGGGYPQGLIEEQIPLAARLLAIADVYEGLISNRVYKVGVPHDQAVAIIFEGRGSHFDPDIVDAFIEIQDDFRAIALRYADTDQDMQRMIEYMANAIAEEALLPAN